MTRELPSPDGEGPRVLDGTVGAGLPDGGGLGDDRGLPEDRALAELPEWLREPLRAVLRASEAAGVPIHPSDAVRTVQSFLGPTGKTYCRPLVTWGSYMAAKEAMQGYHADHAWFDEANDWKAGPSFESLMDEVIEEVVGPVEPPTAPLSVPRGYKRRGYARRPTINVEGLLNRPEETP